jgi:hypothetical protein
MTSAKILLHRTDSNPIDDKKAANLREFARDKQYANDYFGGHKGSSSGEPNDPFKLFRWIGKKISGQKETPEPPKPADYKPPSETDVNKGEIDTHNLL